MPRRAKLDFTGMKPITSKNGNLKISEIALSCVGEPIYLPLAFYSVSAGFSSPADDHLEKGIDLSEWLVKNKLATFIMRVRGDSMNDVIHNVSNQFFINELTSAIEKVEKQS